MKWKLCQSLAFFFVFTCLTAYAQQQPEKPDVYEQAEMEADRLQRILDLEDWQLFYVDSTLKHDFPAMMADYEELQKSKVANTSMYQAVQDKWMDFNCVICCVCCFVISRFVAATASNERHNHACCKQ